MLDLKGHTLLLASQSPRRRELLEGLGVPFQVVSVEADETYSSNLKEGDIPLYIARAKARAYEERLHEGELLLTADTIVWCEKQMLGKPADAKEAHEMLQLLSGKTHQVFTAVCISWKDKEGMVWQNAFTERTDVTFQRLTDEDIDYYIENYRPFDKAGAYGIQEWIGYVGVTGIRGCYFNVMGLPLRPLYKALKQIVSENKN